jgi:hypothetical protein
MFKLARHGYEQFIATQQSYNLLPGGVTMTEFY